MKKSFAIALIILGFALGLLAVTQINSEIVIKSRFPTDDIEARELLLKDYIEEQSSLKETILGLRNQIEDAQASADIRADNANLTILENLKKNLGLNDLKGAGVEIFLDDSVVAHRDTADITDVDLVQAADLRDIVNLLRAGGSQAISINDQRIIVSSPISSVGTTILINNFHAAPPFSIKAIGDSAIMVQRLSNKSLLSSLYERKKNNNILFDIYGKNSLFVPKYNGDLKTDYITLQESNEN